MTVMCLILHPCNFLQQAGFYVSFNKLITSQLVHGVAVQWCDLVWNNAQSCMCIVAVNVTFGPMYTLKNEPTFNSH